MNAPSIESGIPLPLTLKYTKYPLSEMKPGDSFFIPCEEGKTQKPRNSIGMCARSKNIKITIRQVAGGLRCWRLE